MTITYEMENNLYLNITNRCSNECVFCVRDRNTSEEYLSGNDLWLEREPTFDEIITDLESRDVKRYERIVFCGFGEPLARLETVCEVAKWLKTRGIKEVRINTNGQANLIYKRDVTEDLKGLIDTASVSLNAKNAEEYDKICASKFGRRAFSGVIEFSKACIARGIRTILTVVDVMSDDDIEVCRKIAEECGAEFRIRKLI